MPIPVFVTGEDCQFVMFPVAVYVRKPDFAEPLQLGFDRRQPVRRFVRAMFIRFAQSVLECRFFALFASQANDIRRVSPLEKPFSERGRAGDVFDVDEDAARS